MEMGDAVKVDTLEELATAIGVGKNTLVAEFEDCNVLYAASEDLQFHKRTEPLTEKFGFSRWARPGSMPTITCRPSAKAASPSKALRGRNRVGSATSG